MSVIYKYQLALVDRQFVEMPAGSHILSVTEQHGALCLWALVDPSSPPEERVIVIAGTGGPAPDVLPFIGTVLMAAGNLVWHVFGDCR